MLVDGGIFAVGYRLTSSGADTLGALTISADSSWRARTWSADGRTDARPRRREFVGAGYAAPRSQEEKPPEHEGL